MKIEISQDGSKTLVDLPPGTATVGGARADGIHLPGLPPRVVTLIVEPGRLVVEGRRPFVVDRLPVPAARRRLLLPGETVHLAPGLWLRQSTPDAGAPRPGHGAATMAVARELLAEPRDAPGKAGALICLTGLDLGRVFPLADGAACVGRGDQADVLIRDRHASRRHARLSRRGDGMFVEDLGSPNGVLVNGRRIQRAHPLIDGDVLELGTTLLFFRSPAPEPAPASPSSPPPPPAAQEPEPAPAAGPGPEAAPPPATGLGRRLDVALILAGLLLAFLGAALTVTLSRDPAPALRGRPAAPSAGDAVRRSW
jgi:hypothetical protein